MYVVDTTTNPGDLRRMRFVVSAADLSDISNGDGSSPLYGYAVPAPVQHYFNRRSSSTNRTSSTDARFGRPAAPDP
jgi:hypothetical protein